MSYDQNEINDLKKILFELSKKVNDALPSSSTSRIEQIYKPSDKNNSENYLKIYELQVELEKITLDNKRLKQEFSLLENDKNKMIDDYNKNVDKIEYYKDKIEKHEKSMRKLFELYSSDKQDMFKQQLLIEKLQQEVYNLKNSLNIQEQRYQNLKSQLSYRLGSRLVGLKKSKDLLKLPKELLDDYIAVKSKVKNSDILLVANEEQSNLPYLGNREYIKFDKKAIFPLKDDWSTVIFKKDFKGSVDLQLYGVKPLISIDIELTIRAHQGDCTFSIIQGFQHTHHLATNESMKVHVTLNDKQSNRFINIFTCNGTIEIGFKKIRGVPSFIHLYANEKDSRIVDGFNTFNNENNIQSTIPKKNTVLPKLKQKNGIFIEAWEVNKSQGFEMAKKFVTKYGSLITNKTLYILEADNHLDNEDIWLELINKYIISYGINPITLKKGKEEKYHRIVSKTNYSINEQIKISVIMPVFNSEKTIEMAMQSILQQTWQNLELIVVNDCSTDHTLMIINRVAALDRRVKVIDNPCNVGAYVSKNLGLKFTTGDYITGHDADDWAHPQRLEKHIQLIQSEEVPPRASNTRMIRMEENGFLRMYKISTFCHDAVLRIASITCMFEANFLKNILGGWDCARFGADSEIISRCKMVIGDEFKNYQTLSMICLDEPTSLTNDPVHGVSKTTGISPTRKFYKEQWEAWHKTLDKENVYLDFPHLDRKFQVPNGTEIPKINILKSIMNIETDNE